MSYVYPQRFSALQRAEIAEMVATLRAAGADCCFSALQRAEIAEIQNTDRNRACGAAVSVLFNEPKLLKLLPQRPSPRSQPAFQCSSTSRNC